MYMYMHIHRDFAKNVSKSTKIHYYACFTSDNALMIFQSSRAMPGGVTATLYEHNTHDKSLSHDTLQMQHYIKMGRKMECVLG